ncbi:MAG: hypothetical protein LBT66_04685 [Methanobrevibacter sp.]|nr:hypothetical protein [Candidatus Methanovirga meridionalis]
MLDKQFVQGNYKTELDKKIMQCDVIKKTATIPLNEEINLANRGVRIVITKRGNQIIIAIKKDNNKIPQESINKVLNNGLIPQEILYLQVTIAYELFKKHNISLKDNKNVIFTGYGEGGKIATILATFNNTRVRCFFDHYPINIRSIADFLPNDTAIDAGSFSYNLESSKANAIKTASLLAFAIGFCLRITNPIILCVSLTIKFVRVFIQDVKKENHNLKWIDFFTKLENEKIIKNVTSAMALITNPQDSSGHLYYAGIDIPETKVTDVLGKIGINGYPTTYIVGEIIENNTLFDISGGNISPATCKVNYEAFIKISLLVDLLEYKIERIDGEFIFLNSKKGESIVFLVKGNKIIKEMFLYPSASRLPVEEEIHLFKELITASSLDKANIGDLVYKQSTGYASRAVIYKSVKNAVVNHMIIDTSSEPLNFCNFFITLFDFFKIVQTNYKSKKNTNEKIGYYFTDKDTTAVQVNLTLNIGVDVDNARSEAEHFFYMTKNKAANKKIDPYVAASIMKKIFSTNNEKWVIGDEFIV